MWLHLQTQLLLAHPPPPLNERKEISLTFWIVVARTKSGSCGDAGIVWFGDFIVIFFFRTEHLYALH